MFIKSHGMGIFKDLVGISVAYFKALSNQQVRKDAYRALVGNLRE
jgi:hypothetical protein